MHRYFQIRSVLLSPFAFLVIGELQNPYSRTMALGPRGQA